jgi:DNA-binding response OmpR family regulator
MSEPLASPAHVLLVEDSEIAASALRILLEAHGYRVTIAASVADAVRAGLADPPALLLLDLTLPDGDGLGVLEALRAGDVTPAATVALTGDDAPATIDRCMRAGCTEVMLKPVPARELVRRLGAIVTA